MKFDDIIPGVTRFSCRLGCDRVYIPKAMLSIHGGGKFVCQDVLEGCECSNKMGFKYSWGIWHLGFGDNIVEDIKPIKMNHEK